MTHRDHPGAETASTLAPFRPDVAWAITRVDDAQAIEPSDIDLDAFGRYPRDRILTDSLSVRMLHTVVEGFAESHVECVLSYSRVVDNVAFIIALQTAAMGVGNGRTVQVAIRCRVKWGNATKFRTRPSSSTRRRLQPRPDSLKDGLISWRSGALVGSQRSKKQYVIESELQLSQVSKRGLLLGGTRLRRAGGDR